MKINEKEILDAVNNEFNIDLVWNDYEYNRFDAENLRYIAEIKDRHSFYKDTMIEFDKYSYNIKYADLMDKDFIYIVRMSGSIYIFNLTKKDVTFGWQWKEIEATTNFDRRELVKKFVGYLNIDNCIKKIDG